jgi:hypothetical protein
MEEPTDLPSPEEVDKRIADSLVWCVILLTTYRKYVENPGESRDLPELLQMDAQIRGPAIQLLKDNYHYLFDKYGIDLKEDPFQ